MDTSSSAPSGSLAREAIGLDNGGMPVKIKLISVYVNDQFPQEKRA